MFFATDNRVSIIPYTPEEKDKCTICWKKNKKENFVRTTCQENSKVQDAAQHIFHKECLEEWGSKVKILRCPYDNKLINTKGLKIKKYNDPDFTTIFMKHLLISASIAVIIIECVNAYRENRYPHFFQFVKMAH